MPSPAVTGPTPQTQTAAHITTTIETFLAEHPHSILLEDGRTLFDLRDTQYALTAEHDRATLHLWSGDRNLVRRILAVTPRADALRLTTKRFGQPRPQTLELTPDKHLRTPSTRDTTRHRYLRLLERVLLRAFPDDRSEGFRSAMDLERSFGPGYARGTLIRGQQAWAVIAVNIAETQATIDGTLSIGILWLQHCRDHAAPTATRKGRLYQGLRIIVPRGAAATTLSRLPWLNSRIAQYELFELDEQTEDLTRRDPADQGNLTTRLPHAPHQAAALERFATAIPQVLALLPPNTPVLGLDQNMPARLHSETIQKQQKNALIPTGGAAALEQPAVSSPAHRNTALGRTPHGCELRLRSNTELAFLLHGLEFARIRSAFAGQSFNRQLEVTVGSGPAETLLLPSTQSHLRELVRHLFDRRRSRRSVPKHHTGPALPHPAGTLARKRPPRRAPRTRPQPPARARLHPGPRLHRGRLQPRPRHARSPRPHPS